MSNRWFVYRESETLGPFDAHEVRAGLRSGDLDPFDKVGLEGSNIQRALLDIDEIFVTEDEQAPSIQQPDLKLPEEQLDVSGSDIQPKAQEADLRAAPNSKRSSGQGYLGGAIEKIKDSEEVSAVVKKYKSYFVLSKKNIWGPFSYRHIVELYKKGTVPADARVKKNGYSKSVPIKSFVKKHTPKKKNNVHSANIIALQNNKRRLIIVKSEGRSVQWLSLAIVFVCLVIALAMALTFLKSNDSEAENQQTVAPTRPSAKFESTPSPSTSQLSRSKASQPTSFRAATKIPVRKSRVQSKKSIKKETASRSKVTAAPQRAFKKPPTTRRSSTRTASGRKTKLSPKRSVSRGVSRVASRKKPTLRKSAVRNPTAVQSASLGIIPSLRGREGDEVTMGPLAFSVGKLQGCSNKCLLNFADRNAKTISVMFFKGAYMSKLLSKKGAAILQGTVSDGGNTLILQNVR